IDSSFPAFLRKRRLIFFAHLQQLAGHVGTELQFPFSAVIALDEHSNSRRSRQARRLCHRRSAHQRQEDNQQIATWMPAFHGPSLPEDAVTVAPRDGIIRCISNCSSKQNDPQGTVKSLWIP